VAYPEGTLWRSKVDGSERLQLCFEPMSAVMPRWSPDARRIAFTGITPGKPSQIYLVSADGGSPERLTEDQRNHGGVSWSPDGNSLVFGDLEGDNATAINVLDLRTRRVSTVPGSEGLYTVRWSPDGRYLAAKTKDDSKMMGFDFKTGNWTEWAKIGITMYLNWSRDGKYVYFDSALGSEPAFYRLRVGDHKLERLVSVKELGRQASGFLAPWTGLAPDDSLLALRDIGSQEIYALDWEMP
jgi:Tol biopolymer transport system component